MVRILDQIIIPHLCCKENSDVIGWKPPTDKLIWEIYDLESKRNQISDLYPNCHLVAEEKSKYNEAIAQMKYDAQLQNKIVTSWGGRNTRR